MKETHLRNQILDYLAYKNIFCWLTNNQGNYNKNTNSYYKNPRLLKGVADILGVHKGRFLSIECKIKPNKQSEYQKEFEKNVIKNGGIYILAYELEDVEEFFKSKTNKELLEPYKPKQKEET